MRRHLIAPAIVTGIMVGVLVVALSSGARGAGNNASEQAAIRKLIAADDRREAVPRISDDIFWSGAYKRPRVSPEKPDPSVTNRVPGSEKSHTEVIRIIVADSADLAYEYSKSTLEFDRKSGEHVKFDTGLLRVWQKQDGVWKQAAVFAFPYDRGPQPQ